MIEKPVILVTSLGRTGTEFFARLFAGILPDATSLHEPDIFQNTGVEHRLARFLQQVRVAGPWRLVVLKALGKWTLVNISDQRFLGRLDNGQAKRALAGQRRGFIERMPGSVYMEANIGYYGLLDILPQVFRQHRTVYVVRDGREWVRSHMNWGEAYGKRGLRRLLSHNWPAASQLTQDPCAAEWPGFSRFEKLCWAWARLNEYALQGLSGNDAARLFRFEDIFAGAQRYDVLSEVVGFAVSLPGLDPGLVGRSDGWLERKVHQSSQGFPAWEEWTAAQKVHFTRTCGPLMERLGYPLN